MSMLSNVVNALDGIRSHICDFMPKEKADVEPLQAEVSCLLTEGYHIISIDNEVTPTERASFDGICGEIFNYFEA